MNEARRNPEPDSDGDFRPRSARAWDRILEIWGDDGRGFSVARDLFLRLVGVVSIVASWSLAVQVQALYGVDGILPYTEYLQLVDEWAMGEWSTKLMRAPTLLWWLPESSGLQLCAWGGVVFGALLALGVAPRLVIPAIWLCYLSVLGVGRVFLSFQWDVLLLETLVVAWFLSPWSLWMKPRPLGTTWAGHAAARFLIFKLMWLSGWVKLASNDEAWASMTALEYHFWTQPLPTWTAYWADHLPALILAAATFVMFVIELVVPFFVFAPRRLRHWAAALLIALQVGIAATGNYGFFNLLTIVLTLLMFDDGAFLRVSGRFERWISTDVSESAPKWRRYGAIAVAAGLIGASSVGFSGRFAPDVAKLVPQNLRVVLSATRSFNGYGLFAVMTKDRREIGIELSADGENWEPVDFRYKPDDLGERPGFIGPHMPRLDWQMWFAGLGDCTSNTWLVFTARELVEQNEDVIELFESVPRGEFRYARFPSYQYRFGDDAWWSREQVDDFCPVLDFSDGQIRRGL